MRERERERKRERGRERERERTRAPSLEGERERDGEREREGTKGVREKERTRARTHTDGHAHVVVVVVVALVNVVFVVATYFLHPVARHKVVCIVTRPAAAMAHVVGYQMLTFQMFLGDCDIPSKIDESNCSRLYYPCVQLRAYQVFIKVADAPKTYILLGEMMLPWPEWFPDKVLSNIYGRFPQIGIQQTYIVEWVGHPGL